MARENAWQVNKCFQRATLQAKRQLSVLKNVEDPNTVWHKEGVLYFLRSTLGYMYLTPAMKDLFLHIGKAPAEVNFQ